MVNDEDEEEILPYEDWGLFEFSMKYPFTNRKSKYSNVLVGVLFITFIILVLPIFPIVGYIFKIKEMSAKGEDEVAQFSGWLQLSKEGIFAIINYLPVFSVVILIHYASTYLTGDLRVLLILISYTIAGLFIPSVGVIYAVRRDIKSVYLSKELYRFVFSITYMIGLFKYIFFLLFIFLFFVFGSVITLGLGAIVLTPVLLYSRPAFWGYIYYRWNS
jgi:hypothetical protein